MTQLLFCGIDCVKRHPDCGPLAAGEVGRGKTGVLMDYDVGTANGWRKFLNREKRKKEIT